MSASNRNCSLSCIDSISVFSSGLRLCSSAAAWIPVMRGIDTSRIARSTSSFSARSTASAPSSASATTSRSGFASSTLREPRADDRVVVGDQDPCDERDRHQRHRLRRDDLGCRHFQPHLDPAAGCLLDRERAADEQRPLAHAAQAAVLNRCAGEAAAVVGDTEDDAVVAALERDRHTARLGVAGDVRQALLRDAVDGELDLRRQRRQRGRELTLDPDAGDARERGRKLGQRTHQAEVLEHLRPQLARDPPHLVERAAHRLARLVERVAMLRRGVGDRVQLQQHPGQDLADLVVQVARDPDPLGLLGGEHTPAALLPFALEAVEHPVERRDHPADLVVADDLQPLPRPQQVDHLHPLRQAPERRERAPQQAPR